MSNNFFPGDGKMKITIFFFFLGMKISDITCIKNNLDIPMTWYAETEPRSFLVIGDPIILNRYYYIYVSHKKDE